MVPSLLMENCPHLPGCGGCTLQHFAYADQLSQKQLVIEKLFPATAILPIIPCKNPWHYRNKMEFSFSQNLAGDRFLGLILRKSRGKVFNLQTCAISPPWFSNALQKVRTWWETSGLRAFHFRKGEGTLRTLTLREGRRTQERLAMLTVSGDPRFAPTRSQLNNFVEALGDPAMSIFLRIQQAIAGHPTQFFEMHLSGPTHIEEKLEIQGKSLTFKISPTSFFQPNTDQAELLYTTALDMVGSSKRTSIYDLYAGTATLGMAFAPLAQKVVAIELNPHAVFDARMNAELNQIGNIEVICGDVGKTLALVTKSPDLVVIDPPRPGLDATALEAILRLQPRQILYISCNPVTQASNIAQLVGYQLVKVQPVDQFPHTPHIENIALLERKM
jgi:23S rRNA (uracil1939-C5)-methyltransferase